MTPRRRPPPSGDRCATSCGGPKRPPSGCRPINSVPSWAPSRSATSAGGPLAAPTCSTMSASTSATASGRRWSVPTASASRRSCASIAGDLTPIAGTITVDGTPRRDAPAGRHRRRGRDRPDDGARSPRVARPDRRSAPRRGSWRPPSCGPPTSRCAYADALADWGDHGGYVAEQHWDECLTRAVGLGLDEVAARPLRTFSGGEQKRMALEVLLRGDDDVLLLDEPDNFLDVPAKRWLEGELRTSRKTILFVSHDRELLAAAATRIVTVEANGTWTHGGGFAGYHEARQARLEKLSQRPVVVRRRAQAPRRHRGRDAAAGQLRRQLRAEAQGGREPAAPVRRAERTAARGARPEDRRPPRRGPHRQAGGDHRAARARRAHRPVRRRAVVRRAGRRARSATASARATSCACSPATSRSTTTARGASAPASSPACSTRPTSTRSGPGGRCSTSSTTTTSCAARRWACCAATSSTGCADQPFETLSGGQQARFQILLLERSGATLLLLDEPTDNLDLVSAEALEHGLAQFTGTVIAVTHDRWFLRGFDRFLEFRADCSVHRPHGRARRLAMTTAQLAGGGGGRLASASCWTASIGSSPDVRDRDVAVGVDEDEEGVPGRAHGRRRVCSSSSAITGESHPMSLASHSPGG